MNLLGTQLRDFGAPLAAILTWVAIIAAVSPPQLALTQPVAPDLKKRHVIVAFDVSTSMRNKKKMNVARMKDVRDSLKAILFEKPPSKDGHFFDVNEQLLREPDIDMDNPLYSQGDVLTYFTFEKEVAYKLQRHKTFIDKQQFAGKLPEFPRDFSGDWSFLDAAKVAAFDNFYPAEEKETLVVMITDRQKDPPPDKASEGVEILKRLDLYEKGRHLEPVYSVFLHHYVWINVYKIRTLTRDEPPPPGEMFQIVEPQDRKRALSELRFQLTGQGMVTPAAPYVVMPNPLIGTTPSITKIEYTIKHLRADEPLVTKTVYSGYSSGDFKLDALKPDARFIGPEYRMRLSIEYRSPSSSKTNSFVIDELVLLPEPVCEFCIADHEGKCREQGLLALSEHKGTLRSPDLMIGDKQTVPGPSCVVSDMNLLIQSHNCPDCLVRRSEMSGGGGSASEAAGFRIVLTGEMAQAVRRCEKPKGVIQVFFEAGQGGKKKIQELPLTLTLEVPEAEPKDALFGPKGQKDVKGIVFERSEGLLSLPDHTLTVGKDSRLRKARFERVTVKIGPSLQWTFGPVEGKDLPFDAPLPLSEEQAILLDKHRPTTAEVEVEYRFPCADQPKVFTLKLPVTAPSPECPENALFVSLPEGNEGVGEIRATRDPSHRLVIDGLTVKSTLAGHAASQITQVEHVDLSVGPVRKEWADIAVSSLPLELPKTVLSVEESGALQEGANDGALTIRYSCASADGQSGQVVIPVRLIVPATKGPSFVLTDKKGTPIQRLSASLFFSRSRLETAYLREDGAKTPKGLGYSVKKIELGPSKVDKVWASWAGGAALPIQLRGALVGIKDGLKGDGAESTARITLTYNLQGVPGEKTSVIDIPLKVRDWTWLSYLLLIPLLGVAGWGAYKIIELLRRPLKFKMVIYRDDFSSLDTDVYSLRPGQRLSLFADTEGGQRCVILDCPGVYLENRKRELFLVRPDQADERVDFGAAKRYPALEKGVEIQLEIRIAGETGPDVGLPPADDDIVFAEDSVPGDEFKGPKGGGF